MQVGVSPPIARVTDPASVWTGRTGDIVDRGPNELWWRDHLTGTRVPLTPNQITVH